MIKINWELEEAVALFDLYFQNNMSISVPMEILEELSQRYKKRAYILGLCVDEKFRNVAGLKRQLACIHYVVTDGREGLSNASKLFYQTYDLYLNDPDNFKMILSQFNNKY